MCGINQIWFCTFPHLICRTYPVNVEYAESFGMTIPQRNVVMLMEVARTPRQRQFLLALLAAQIVERPLIPNIRINLDTYSDANAILDFRFDVVGIRKLGYYFGIPAVVITSSRNRALRDEALCVVLGRLALPTRLHDMSKTFG